MGFSNYPEISQQKMNDLFHGCESISAYIDEPMILKKGDWTDHVQKLELTLNKLKEKLLKFNLEDSFFGQSKMEYLGLWVTRNGAKPIHIKIEAINNMKPTTSQKKVHKFTGVANYCRNMWPRRSHTLAPLTRIFSNKRKFKWMKVKQDAFGEIKRTADRDNLFTYRDFNEIFKIDTNASAFQLGAVIRQKGIPITFYVRKLTDAQQGLKITEKKPLIIFETQKKFKTILLHQKLSIYTYYKNVTCKNFNTDRVLICRLILEEYGKDIEYTKYEKHSSRRTVKIHLKWESRYYI